MSDNTGCLISQNIVGTPAHYDVRSLFCEFGYYPALYFPKVIFVCGAERPAGEIGQKSPRGILSRILHVLFVKTAFRGTFPRVGCSISVRCF